MIRIDPRVVSTINKGFEEQLEKERQTNVKRAVDPVPISGEDVKALWTKQNPTIPWDSLPEGKKAQMILIARNDAGQNTAAPDGHKDRGHMTFAALAAQYADDYHGEEKAKTDKKDDLGKRKRDFNYKTVEDRQAAAVNAFQDNYDLFYNSEGKNKQGAQVFNKGVNMTSEALASFGGELMNGLPAGKRIVQGKIVDDNQYTRPSGSVNYVRQNFIDARKLSLPTVVSNVSNVKSTDVQASKEYGEGQKLPDRKPQDFAKTNDEE